MKTLLKSIQYGMLDCIEGEDEPEYAPEDVTACITLLLEFLTEIEFETQTQERAKSHIKDLVISLNDLNTKCDGNLIESDQCEEICEFISKTIANANVELSEDFTKEWRYSLNCS